MRLINRSSGYHVLNFTATNLQLYKIFKIMRVSFLGHVVVFFCQTLWQYSDGVGGPANRGIECRMQVGYEKIAIFYQYLAVSKMI